MSEPDVLPQQQRENAEPYERARPVPWFVLLVLMVMFGSSVLYILGSEADTPSAWGDGRSLAELSGAAKPSSANAGIGATEPDGAAQASGATLYSTLCAACHQASGTGLPGVFPPLAGSDWVNGKDSTLAAIVLHGINGQLTVNGAAFSGAMPSFKAQLSDEQVAAVLSHVRSAWGNASPPVAPQTVARVRDALKARTEAFAGDQDLAALR